MLLPEELSFLKYLKAAKVPLNEYEFPTSKLANVQSQLEKLVQKNYFLHQSAKEAYRWVLCLESGVPFGWLCGAFAAASRRLVSCPCSQEGVEVNGLA